MRWLIRNTAVGAAVLLIIAPVVALAWRSVEQAAWQTSTLRSVQTALVLSFSTSLVSLALIFMAGTPLAYRLAHHRSWLHTIIELPIVLPPAVAGLGLLMAFGRRGLVGAYLADIGITLPFSSAAVVMAQVFVALPFYVRTAQVGFSSIPEAILDAAYVDGADKDTIFWRIIMPMSWRAIVAGLLLSWARALGEFGATILFAGNLQGRTQTMPLLIYAILERNLDAAIWTALLMVAAALLTLTLAQFLLRRPAD